MRARNTIKAVARVLGTEAAISMMFETHGSMTTGRAAFCALLARRIHISLRDLGANVSECEAFGREWREQREGVYRMLCEAHAEAFRRDPD